MAGDIDTGLAGSGFEAPPPIDLQLRQAAEVYADTAAAEHILNQALAQDPQCLAAYFSQYKFYFYKRRLQDAEQTALRALEVAAQLGGFGADWEQLTPGTVDWSRVDAPQHFYLFTLKALAFMCLRLGRATEARAILEKLTELDPRDSVGANVVRALSVS